MSLNQSWQVNGVLPVPLALFHGKLVGIVAGVKLQRVDQIAMHGGRTGPEASTPTKGRDGLVEPARFLENIAEVAVSLHEVGSEHNRLTIGCNGFIQWTIVPKHRAEIEICQRVVRF